MIHSYMAWFLRLLTEMITMIFASFILNLLKKEMQPRKYTALYFKLIDGVKDCY